MDSGHLGCFLRNEIVGRSRYVIASLDPDNHFLPRNRRFAASLDQEQDRPCCALLRRRQ